VSTAHLPSSEHFAVAFGSAHGSQAVLPLQPLSGTFAPRQTSSLVFGSGQTFAPGKHVPPPTPVPPPPSLPPSPASPLRLPLSSRPQPLKAGSVITTIHTRMKSRFTSSKLTTPLASLRARFVTGKDPFERGNQAIVLVRQNGARVHEHAIIDNACQNGRVASP